MSDTDITPPVDQPVIIAASPVVEQVSAALRSLAIALGAYAVGRGWLNQGIVDAAIPLLLILGPLAYQQWKVRRNSAKQITMASALPDSVAQVR